MAKAQVEVITSVERRRRWSSAEKERLVAASLDPGAVVSALAREAGLHPSQLYKWRRQRCARRGAAPGFAPVRIIDETAMPGFRRWLRAASSWLRGGSCSGMPAPSAVSNEGATN